VVPAARNLLQRRNGIPRRKVNIPRSSGRFACRLFSLTSWVNIPCHLLDYFGDMLGSMMTNRMTVEEHSDAELVSRSLAGDRDAFSRIVSRYQTLICSLAYSRIGNLGQSEDIAQETFITAWKHLRLLRDPAKLRSWLCGIVRNRIQEPSPGRTRTRSSCRIAGNGG
jgi:Sigma-70 region 2